MRFIWPKRCGDALVVCRDNHTIDQPALFGLINHVLNQRFAGITGDNFGWETGGTKAGRYNNSRSQIGLGAGSKVNLILQSKNTGPA